MSHLNYCFKRFFKLIQLTKKIEIRSKLSCKKDIGCIDECVKLIRVRLNPPYFNLAKR